MNLPHGEALRFAKEVIRRDMDTATVLCEFREIPTLPMFIEAAAQSSAAFAPSAPSDKALIGFLVMSREVKLLAPLQEKCYHFKITREVEIGTMKKFFFEAFDKQESIKYVSGSLTIVTQE